MSAAAAKHRGFYMTHIRDEADKAFDALNEEISIGERAHIPIDHSHIKLGTVGSLGQSASVHSGHRSCPQTRRGFSCGLLSVQRLALQFESVSAR